jgi:phosphoribosylaminoimidazole carboxylase (NCAIR synthetase)
MTEIIAKTTASLDMNNDDYFTTTSIISDGGIDTDQHDIDTPIMFRTQPQQQPRRRNTRMSFSLGDVRTMSLDDIQEIPVSLSNATKPIRVLVTVHSIKPLYLNLYEKGLGLWVSYIIQKYLKTRNVPHRLYMKSIVTNKTSKKTVMNFMKRNKIDYWIPSDVTDTMFAADHYGDITALGVKLAVTPNLQVYQMLEDKWDTFNLMKKFNIPTPDTELFNMTLDQQQYPFFLKVASGTNAGRGVWHCENEHDLKEALKAKETKGKDVVLLRQTPTYGEIVCAEIIFDHGKPLGFFFAKSIQAEDLAGMGKAYVLSQKEEYKQLSSHVKVELEDEQWHAVTKIFKQIGDATKYHGMIDIEFIIAGEGNAHAEPGSVSLLECNPRFSGDIHTTLSNPGFLDLYFNVLNNDIQDDHVVGNYSVGVEMKSSLGQFSPTNFYCEHPQHVISIRHWHVDTYHKFDPNKKQKNGLLGGSGQHDHGTVIETSGSALTSSSSSSSSLSNLSEKSDRSQ